MCGRVVPLCGAIPQMEGGQWGRVCPSVCSFDFSLTGKSRNCI